MRTQTTATSVRIAVHLVQEEQLENELPICRIPIRKEPSMSSVDRGVGDLECNRLIRLAGKE